MLLSSSTCEHMVAYPTKESYKMKNIAVNKVTYDAFPTFSKTQLRYNLVNQLSLDWAQQHQETTTFEKNM